jgi:hypothetical protein
MPKCAPQPFLLLVARHMAFLSGTKPYYFTINPPLYRRQKKLKKY